MRLRNDKYYRKMVEKITIKLPADLLEDINQNKLSLETCDALEGFLKIFFSYITMFE